MKNRLNHRLFSRLTGGCDNIMVRALQGGGRPPKGRLNRLEEPAFPQSGDDDQGKWARSSAVEHLTFNQVVDGSIPSGLTTFFFPRKNAIDLARIDTGARLTQLGGQMVREPGAKPGLYPQL